MNGFWQGLGARARGGLIAGALLIVAIVSALAWWTLRPDWQLLFADLKPQDAAVMTAELDRLKVPYRIADNGASLLVDAPQVHATRIKLMGRELPLHGAVGFELFNNTDFGMTEFAQKINYQRALQGELTRTILSLAEVRDVRVHLALPEQGLFRASQARAKASVALTLREGQALRQEQVLGIQRLVAAAVPGMTIQDVTLVDSQGVALSRLAGDAEGDAGAGRLDVKRETENYLSRKAGAVLERAFGPGQALASVDVTLNMDQVRVTTEDVIAAPPSRPGAPATGVLVRERESSRDAAAPMDARSGSPAAQTGSTQREAEYQVGRRVEQVVSQPGSIRRIQVVAIVRQPLDSRQEEQVRKMLAAAVGAAPERGDTVVVQALDASAAPVVPGAMPGSQATAGGGGEAGRSVPAPARALDTPAWAALALGVVGAVACAWVWAMLRRRSSGPGHPAKAPLSAAERDAALRRVQQWLADGADAPSGGRP